MGSKEKKERVILIKGNDSKWYEQAIFIVNQDTPQEDIPRDFVAEAEKIIHNHVRKKYEKNARNKIGVAYSSGPGACALPAHHTPAASAKRPSKGRNKPFDFFLNTIMGLGCIAIAAFIMWGLMGGL